VDDVSNHIARHIPSVRNEPLEQPALQDAHE